MKYRVEVIIKKKDGNHIQYAKMENLDVIDELFEKLQKTYEPYGAKVMSIRFEKEDS